MSPSFWIANNLYFVSDFTCAVESTVLVHGRMYITNKFICFYSNLFGLEKKIRIPYSHIKAITKENTAMVIPNAIAISTGCVLHMLYLKLNNVCDLQIRKIIFSDHFGTEKIASVFWQHFWPNSKGSAMGIPTNRKLSVKIRIQPLLQQHHCRKILSHPILLLLVITLFRTVLWQVLFNHLLLKLVLVRRQRIMVATAIHPANVWVAGRHRPAPRRATMSTTLVSFFIDTCDIFDSVSPQSLDFDPTVVLVEIRRRYLNKRSQNPNSRYRLSANLCLSVWLSFTTCT